MSLRDREEFFALLSAFCSGELLDDEQRDRFKSLLRSDRAFQTHYLQYVQMHLHLRRALGGIPAAARLPELQPASAPAHPSRSTLPFPAVGRPAPKSNRWQRLVILGGSFAAALVALAVLTRIVSPNPNAPFATLTQSRECIWEVPLMQGAEIGRERLVLTAGVAQLTFGSGAVMLVEAPAEIEPVNARSAFLHSGRVVVRAPSGSDSFTVDSPRARVLDLGTEFGVGVSSGGETLVQVFEGVVVADFNAQQGDRSAQQRRLVAGDAVTLDAEDGSSLRNVSFDQQRFIRRLPDPPAADHIPDKWLVPYNKNRTATMNAVPAPSTPVIDGDLADWDRSAPFESRCSEPYGENYNFTGYIQYDDACVYVGGHIKDPSPMRSVIDPATDPNVSWKGGSIQLRLSCDRAMGWPAKGDLWRFKSRKGLPEDSNPKQAHMTFWYHRPTAKACFYVQYGLDFHAQRANPEGVRGAFKKDPDGLGYTFEYAIPWSLLNAGEDVPRGGDTLAACWNVHWSDNGGRLWKGMLVDLLNPSEQGTTYSRGATWGKLLLQK